MIRILFITNFCPYYRVRTFELLAGHLDAEFVFFSEGDEWFWEQRHGVAAGGFRARTVNSFRVPPGIRLTPGLWPILWRAHVDVFVKDIDGPVPLLMTLAAARLRGKPFVLWTGIWEHPQTMLHRLTFPLVRRIYAWANAIVVYGEHVKSYLVGLGVDPRKIFIAHHAVDNSVYGRDVQDGELSALRARHCLVDGPIVLFVGRLEAVKGLDVLFEAFSRVDVSTGATLLLVGEGSLGGQLRERARLLGIADRVSFAGYVPPGETVPYYALADVVVLPSVVVKQGKELWGLVVNEAMNQGTPVIATTAVGAAAGGLLRHGVTGEIVPYGDVAALAGSLQRMLDDDGYRRELGAAARRSIRGWGNERMVQGFVSAIRFANRRPSCSEAGS